MKCARSLSFLVLVALSVFAFAEGTRTWEQSKFDDLSKGTSKGVSIRSTGGLELSPSFQALATTPSTYIWSIATDDAGNVYTAAGAPARVYRVTPEGSITVVFEAKELQVQAIAIDKSGALYAATTPDGKVYKIERKAGAPAKTMAADKSESKLDSNWTASVFFEPGTKYIWDLALNGSGDLFVATGDNGEIFKVTPRGEHSLFLKTDESHIRVLAFDRKGDLIAGSDGSGLVYRVSVTGQAFVLYSAAKKEITALAVDDAGNIYAAGVGEKRPGGAPATGSPANFANPAQGPQPTLTIGGPTMNIGPMAGPFPMPGMGAVGGSEIYRIAPDGSPLKVWSSREDLVYSLALDANGRLIAGTGNRGRIFAINGDDDYSDLLKASATQITALARGPKGSLYASASNLGKLFVIGRESASEGSYESDVFDAHNFSRWGRLEYRGTGNVDLFVRSGNVDNPDRNWSDWKRVDLAGTRATEAPAARFLQWKTILHSGAVAPRVESVLVNYLPKNIAPEVDEITIQMGVRYQSAPKPVSDISASAAGPGGQRFEPPVPTLRDADSIGIKWAAHDENDDELRYSVFYRGDGENRWLLLKAELSDKFYSFDSTLLPDAGYTVKVVATDTPSHNPGEALSGEKASARFEVDTTPPRIENLAAVVEGGQIHVTFRAADSFSDIKRAEYSIDAGEWQYLEPVGQLSDASTENYDFRVTTAGDSGSGSAQASASKKAPTKQVASDSATEHIVVVRVTDRYDNVGSAKTVVRH